MKSHYLSGPGFGTMISLPISGLLADAYGWQSVFYIFGVLGCIWFVFWALLVFSTPASHRRISPVSKHSKLKQRKRIVRALQELEIVHYVEKYKNNNLVYWKLSVGGKALAEDFLESAVFDFLKEE